ncbi:MAG: trypsin-like peptidase domain-containing protein [Nitrospinae bacterium]|nr:trypsin-like peptidase domain-containing protein [Nitrospinota bacterium]
MAISRIARWAAVTFIAVIAASVVFHAGGIVAKTQIERINKSVVKIFVTIRKPNYFQPWQYEAQVSASGSGFIISGQRILTNAHVAADAVFIEVRKAGDPQKYQATVEAVGHQCDLATLKVADPAFFKETQPLELGGLPGVMDKVSVHGFPEGGDDISITQGVVSRIEQVNYAHSGFDLLGVQVDAAINPGNSGGPAVIGGKVIGVAMQMLSTAQNIGYIIPTPVITHFLEDIKDSVFDGFPEDGVYIQNMENASMRRYHGLAPGVGGALVTKVAFGSSAHGIILPGDVITSVDGSELGMDGTAPLATGIRVPADYLVQRRFIGESVKYGVIRAGKRMTLDVKLKKFDRLIPYEQHAGQPRYYIYGGLVFVPLTVNYLMTWGEQWWKEAPVDLMHMYLNGQPSPERREIALLKNVLAHEVNAGYHEYSDKIVSRVNGAAVADMGEMVARLKESKGEYTVIELEYGGVIILDAGEVAKSRDSLLKLHGIQFESSTDYRPVSTAVTGAKKG